MIDINSISDEKLAAYIDGNLPIDEMSLISEAVNTEFFLSEVVDIVSEADYILDNPSLYSVEMSDYTHNWNELHGGCDIPASDNFDVLDIINNDTMFHQHNDDNIWHNQSSIEPENPISSDTFDDSNSIIDL